MIGSRWFASYLLKIFAFIFALFNAFKADFKTFFIFIYIFICKLSFYVCIFVSSTAMKQ